MKLKLAGTSAVATGEGRGWGGQITKRFVENGVNVVILELNGDVAEQAARELSADAEGWTRIIASVGSVASAGDVAAAFETATAAFGTPQILVNKVGWANLSWSSARLTVTGIRYSMSAPRARSCARAKPLVGCSLRDFRARSFSSLNYEAATDRLCHYAAAKAAVGQTTKVAAAELAPSQVRVNAIGRYRQTARASATS